MCIGSTSWRWQLCITGLLSDGFEAHALTDTDAADNAAPVLLLDKAPLPPHDHNAAARGHGRDAARFHAQTRDGQPVRRNSAKNSWNVRNEIAVGY